MIGLVMEAYLRPLMLSDALLAIAARPQLVPLAGGTDYYPARVDRRPDEAVLDITAIPGLCRIEQRGDHWWIPCLATWSDLIETALPPAFDALKGAARQVGGVQIQNAGTVVGNVCNASPAADGIPCLLALEATVELASTAGARILPLQDFVLGPRRTARRADELVLGLRVPRAHETAQSVFLKLGARRYLVISIAMVAAVLTRAPDGRIVRARIAVGSCSATAQRLPALEAALIGTRGDALTVLDEHLAPLAPIDDIRATAVYRRDAVSTLLRRAASAREER
jgi:CO/xanthine dehydrogenase FAD-binding subunit